MKPQDRSRPAGSRKKPKRVQGDTSDLLITEGGPVRAGKVIVVDSDNGIEPRKPSTRRRRRRNPAPAKDKELVKLNQLFLRAWQKTYDNRRKRLD